MHNTFLRFCGSTLDPAIVLQRNVRIVLFTRIQMYLEFPRLMCERAVCACVRVGGCASRCRLQFFHEQFSVFGLRERVHVRKSSRCTVAFAFVVPKVMSAMSSEHASHAKYTRDNRFDEKLD